VRGDDQAPIQERFVISVTSASIVAFAFKRMSITSFSFRVALVLAAVVAIAATVRLAWRHRRMAAVSVAVLSLVIVAANVGAGINAHYQYYPNLQSLWGYRGADQASWTDALAARRLALERVQLQVRPIARRSPIGTGTSTSPASIPAVPAPPVVPKQAMPAHGLLVQVPIDGVASGFHGRPTEIYLPPAWVANPALRLPVLLLLHGSPGNPLDWARSAEADQTSDRWAALHNGVAPILVMPDINGSFWGDSECTNGVAGNVDTYVSIDVANWVTSHLRPSLDHRQWGVGGLSEGGTCAVSLALRHPTVFSTFLDFSGEDRISHKGGALSLFAGTPAQRRAQLAAYDQYALSANFANPQQVGGWFEVGANDRRTTRKVQRLATSMAQRGFPVQFRARPNSRHNFSFWRKSYADSYEWMANRLGAAPNLGAGRPGGSSAPPPPAGGPTSRTAVWPGAHTVAVDRSPRPR
jgi:S-formylglutathione hydrolase FrmB